MQFQSRCSRVVPLVFAVAALLTTNDRSVSADANTIAIDSITIASNQLTLSGAFGLGTATVVLGSSPLPVVSSSQSQVVATLNPVPHIGTYTVALTVGNKTAVGVATVAARTLGGLVGTDGSISGTGFSASHAFAGNYRVTFPPGTFQIGSPYVFPPVLVTPLFAAGAPNVPNVTAYFINGDQSGSFVVDFSGVDTAFSFSLTQTY
jgi:hypothetical protein